MKQPLKQFSTKEEALTWLSNLDLEYSDNYRFCFMDTPSEVREYDHFYNQGCCGYFDQEIIVDGRLAKIGCNYGH